jgi:hypothetical protein
MEIETYVTCNELFPQYTDQNVDTIFNCLNKKEILYNTIKILNILSTENNDILVQQAITYEMCSTNLRKKVQDIILMKRMSRFIFAGQLFEVIKYLIVSVPDSKFDPLKKLENSSNKELLLYLYLKFSDIWNNKIFTVKRKEKYYNNAIAIHESIKYNLYIPNYYYFIGKLRSLYHTIFPIVFFEEIKTNFNEYFSSVCQYSPNDYINVITFILLFINTNDDYKSGFFENDFIEYLSKSYPNIQTIFADSSISIDDLRKTKNFEKQILVTPFLRVKEGYFLISYIDFLQFALDSQVFKIQSRQKKVDILSIYGKVLEKYVQTIFERIYPSSEKLTNRLKFNISYEKSEIDCCIENIQSYIFIEVKNSYINTNFCDVNNPDLYLEELNKKYGLQTNSKKKKGIGQLAQHVVSYSNHCISDLQPNKKIIPVLITNDPLIPIAISNKYLRETFDQLISDLPDKQHFVGPLVIISIRELELMEESIQEYGFEKIIKAYYAYNRTGNLTLFDLFTEHNDFKLFENENSIKETMESLETMGFSFIPKLMKKKFREQDF